MTHAETCPVRGRAGGRSRRRHPGDRAAIAARRCAERDTARTRARRPDPMAADRIARGPRGRYSDEDGPRWRRRDAGRRYGDDDGPRRWHERRFGGPREGMMPPMMERGAMMRPFGMAHVCGPNGARIGEMMMDRVERATQPTTEQRPGFDRLKEAAGKAGEIMRGGLHHRAAGHADGPPRGRREAPRRDARSGAHRPSRDGCLLRLAHRRAEGAAHARAAAHGAARDGRRLARTAEPVARPHAPRRTARRPDRERASRATRLGEAL